MFLITGGAGYIGSHTCLALLQAGYDIAVVDDLRNSREEALRRVRELSGRDFPFYRVNVCDRTALEEVFDEQKVEGVIHFAGLKAVGESVEQPLRYYRNNLDATLTLMECMRTHNVKRIVFSSSATVYGDPERSPIPEEAPTTGCGSPYGWTKWMSERILMDAAAADPALRVLLLRYFNPVGAHESGRIGEDPRDTPNNLMPCLSRAANGQYPVLHVYGDDYPTPDGTCIRDYIHVWDLALGHVRALDYSAHHRGCEAINLGTGKGVSVLELLHAYERVNHLTIPYIIDERRPGDVPAYYALTEKAAQLLDWKAERTLEDMCRDTHKWVINNPNGYDTAG